ncbi:MAG: hypothetical protein JWR13_2120 [Mycobacterium sp.]|nr:hypothetical protein [Mycobacterium sp.]
MGLTETGLPVTQRLLAADLTVVGYRRSAAPSSFLHADGQAGLPRLQRKVDRRERSATPSPKSTPPTCALIWPKSVPAAAITTALARLPAVWAVVLWSQCPQTADVAGVRMLAATSEVAVMIAGPGWDGAALGRRVGRLDTLCAAVERLSATH